MAALKGLKPKGYLVCSEDVTLCEEKHLPCQPESSVAVVWHGGVPVPSMAPVKFSGDAGAGC